MPVCQNPATGSGQVGVADHRHFSDHGAGSDSDAMPGRQYRVLADPYRSKIEIGAGSYVNLATTAQMDAAQDQPAASSDREVAAWTDVAVDGDRDIWIGHPQ